VARIDDVNRPTEESPVPILTLIGINHRSATIAELEQAALDTPAARGALQRARSDGRAVEAAVIATCNRTEAYLVGTDDRTAGLGRELVQGFGGVSPDAIYVKFGRDAVAHLCRVAAGIDSLMVGEVQILGQVKAAHLLALEEQCAGPFLGRLFATAFRAGKRARTETQIGQGAVSVSFAALGLAQKIFSDLRERTLLIVGAGETAALAGRHFSEAGAGSILVANRTWERGVELAEALGGKAVRLADLPGALIQADIVVTATGAPAPVITRDMVAEARGRRGRRPLVFIDIAMPRDVEPRVNDLEGVFVHDMSALDAIVQRNIERRRREIPHVEAIVAEEVERHETWVRSLGAVATIRDLRAHFERVQAEEVASWQGKLSASEIERLERASRAIVNRLLHEPMTRIRRPRRAAGDAAQFLAAARELFGLDDDPDDRSSEDDRS
jgi:glutamyl-tRNA reductase